MSGDPDVIIVHINKSKIVEIRERIKDLSLPEEDAVSNIISTASLMMLAELLALFDLDDLSTEALAACAKKQGMSITELCDRIASDDWE